MNLYVAYLILWLFCTVALAAIIDHDDGFWHSIVASLVVQALILAIIGMTAAVFLALDVAFGL